MASYQQALQNYQNQQALAQQRTSMRAQLKGMTAGPQKKALRKQVHGVNRAIKSQPTPGQLDRQQYLAGAQPGSYDIRMGGAPDTSGGMSGDMSGGGNPTSLGSINDLMQSLGGGGQNYLQQFQQAQGGGYGPQYGDPYAGQPGGY
jgi:hypothetical protein